MNIKNDNFYSYRFLLKKLRIGLSAWGNHPALEMKTDSKVLYINRKKQGVFKKNHVFSNVKKVPTPYNTLLFISYGVK